VNEEFTILLLVDALNLYNLLSFSASSVNIVID